MIAIDLDGLGVVRARTLAWREPLEVLSGLADRDGVAGLISDGGPDGRWSYVAAEPDRTLVIDPGQADGYAALAGLPLRPEQATGPAPFAGGWIGLVSYDLGARRMIGRPPADWPDLMLARFPGVLAFDHVERRLVQIGRGATGEAAQDALARTDRWLELRRSPLKNAARSTGVEATPEAAYRAAVGEVVERIGRGELFQANVGRVWAGRLAEGDAPFDVFARTTAAGPAPYAAWLRLGEHAVASNSPERFLKLGPDGRLDTLPIKGTRPRSPDPDEDAAAAAHLIESAKDRAENLMIVDLMRNDLARVSEPGSVRVEALFALRSFERVHHLVSRVTSRPSPGASLAELMEATFPPGSITGAPKHQAMRVIAAHEPPRGPWCGSLFWIGADGGLDASVLIRTLAFTRQGAGWSWRAAAGAGVTADSDPQGELDETSAKIAALAAALGFNSR